MGKGIIAPRWALDRLVGANKGHFADGSQNDCLYTAILICFYGPTCCFAMCQRTYSSSMTQLSTCDPLCSALSTVSYFDSHLTTTMTVVLVRGQR